MAETGQGPESGPKSGQMKSLRVTVVASLRPRHTQEWQLELPTGATVQDALKACGLNAGSAENADFTASIWSRVAAPQRRLHDLDRVEWCRGLKVDPMVARRERFASQGKRGAGLFSKQRPGGKAGY